jgi:hypothetical protein
MFWASLMAAAAAAAAPLDVRPAREFGLEAAELEMTD